ncbi:class I SAM-dependent methyltransferase [Candidatus Saccharibacteria bacterium]|nr:class I SAM-dependent methyltransferase [Candidatus Saccharibacteria bacterium]
MMQSPLLESAITFYDQIAPFYSQELAARAEYVGSINRLVIEALSRSGSSKIIDIGCGNGERARTIADNLDGVEITGIDTSAEMAKQASLYDINVINIDIAQELTQDDVDSVGGNDAALCLWNVLGHIKEAKRQVALMNMKRLLDPNGQLMIDVNNRHNRAAYGLRPALRNTLKDFVSRNDNRHGDFPISRNVGEKTIATETHIFSWRELLLLLEKSGFNVLETYSVNYETGEIEWLKSAGQIFIIAEKG